jgi:hypothetical protein
MNSTATAMPAHTANAGGLSGEAIANITLGVINITMAAAQLFLGYMTYRTSRSERL